MEGRKEGKVLVNFSRSEIRGWKRYVEETIPKGGGGGGGGTRNRWDVQSGPVFLVSPQQYNSPESNLRIGTAACLSLFRETFVACRRLSTTRRAVFELRRSRSSNKEYSPVAGEIDRDRDCSPLARREKNPFCLTLTTSYRPVTFPHVEPPRYEYQSFRARIRVSNIYPSTWHTWDT